MQSSQGLPGLSGEWSLSHSRKVAFSIIALSLIIFSIYGNSFDCSWHFDDRANIVDNPNLHLEDFSWDSVKKTLFSNLRDPGTIYRPIACLSFALNYYFSGLDVFGFHAVNILIHLFSSIFLFLFIYNTLNLPLLKRKYAKKAYAIALLSTVLWAINPVQTQAVTYIVQRMASLAGMFLIIAMYLYLKARTSEKRGARILFYVLCFISSAMAFGSKENAAMLPVVLLLYEALIIQEHTGRFFRVNIKKIFFILGITMLVGLAYVFYKNGNLSSLLANGYGWRPFSMTQRLLTEPRIIIFYISLLIYPVPNRLSIAHSIQISNSPFDPLTTLPSILLVLGGIACLVFTAKKHPFFSFCLLFFFLNHVIESTIFPLELVFEHRNYIPSMLFFVPLAAGFFDLQERYASERYLKCLLSVFMILLLTGFGHSTFVRNFTWKNPESLWTDAVEKAPDQSRVHHNLGKYYQDHGYTEQAMAEYEKALKGPVIHSKNEKVRTYFNLGRLYEDIGNFEKAKSSYEMAVRMEPDFSHALVNLASLYGNQGKDQLADHYLKKAIKADPFNPYVNFNMGLFSLRNRLPYKALHHLMISMKSKDLEGRALLHMGIAYKQTGRLGRAVACLRKAAVKDAHNITPHLYLAEIFCRTGQGRLSHEEAEKIVNFMMHSRDLFYETIDLISKKGHLPDVQLSARFLFPLIAGACDDREDQLNVWRKYMKKTLEKDKKKDKKVE